MTNTRQRTRKTIPTTQHPHTPLLGVGHTTDHEIVPRPCKICDWLLNSS